jgi:hypothetical protein
MRLTPLPLHTDSGIDQLVNALTQLWKACPISSGKFVALARKDRRKLSQSSKKMVTKRLLP